MIDDAVFPAVAGQAVFLGKLQGGGGADLDTETAEAAILMLVEVDQRHFLLGPDQLDPFHGDQLGGADAGAHFAGDALVRLGLGINDKLGIAPIPRGHLELFPRVLDGDDGLDKIADGDRHARQQTPETHRNFFEITHHRYATFIPAASWPTSSEF